jgi:MFS family permease
VTETLIAGYSTSQLASLRRRTVLSLMAGVALGSTGHIAAVGAATLSRFMASRGRRAGLVVGYVIAVIGALIATVAVNNVSLPLFMVGMLFVGFGNSANLLSRYAAADLYPAARRASAIGLVVWGATFGAVLGPNLVGWAGELSEMIGLPALAGAYLLPIVFVGGAAIMSFVTLRPDPYELADKSEIGTFERPPGQGSLESILRRPHVPAVIVALVAGQAVMVLIMTMTPLHMADHGHDLAAVGFVISGHILGMYALSPISGRLTDRFGSAAIVTAGLLVVAFAAVLSAVAPPEGGPMLFIALFLLGYGWNLGFVAGSALLTHGLEVAERTRLQGLTDALIWSSSAAASIGSGVVVAVAGFTALGLMGAALVVVPVWLVVARRRVLAT